jgi:hypothetical protein
MQEFEYRPSEQHRPAETQHQQDRSHEELVRTFQTLIQQGERQFGTGWSQEELVHFILRTEQFSRSPSGKEAQAFYTLRSAWDALAYERYTPGSRAETQGGFWVFLLYRRTQEPTIKLSPEQTQIIDALTEAVGIPHQRGQADIEIPEKLRNYEKWTSSVEYRQRREQAQAKPGKPPARF